MNTSAGHNINLLDIERPITMHKKLFNLLHDQYLIFIVV